MDDRALGLARELEVRDEELAAALEELAELERETEALRSRAADVAAFLERLPDERRRLADAVGEARAEVGRRRDESAVAERELGEAESRRRQQEAVAAARRAVVRTRDAAASAERKLARLECEVTELESSAAGAEADVPRVEVEARRLAEELRTHPRVARAGADEPRPGLAGILDWADRARATLFVARGGLETERERVVREANELGASALGEPMFATSVALVRRRIEGG
jgi:chromosome segregation ATPase